MGTISYDNILSSVFERVVFFAPGREENKGNIRMKLCQGSSSGSSSSGAGIAMAGHFWPVRRSSSVTEER